MNNNPHTLSNDYRSALCPVGKWRFLQRSGLEWEPLLIVSAESVRSLYKFWMPLPLPLSALQRTSLNIANH
jgi:hypothetical protein